MPVIVKSRKTGKYLKRHSGSYRDFLWRLSRKVGTDREDAYMEAFSAKPGDAKVYASHGSAMTSVGKYSTHIAPEARKKMGIKGRVMVLPDDLEIHEIEEIKIVVKR